MSPKNSVDPLERAHEICLRVLAHRPHSRYQLLTKLRQRSVADSVSEQVLDRLAAVGLIDDEQFARAWVESRQSRRPQGKHGLASELARRGVDRETVARVLEAILEQEDSLSAACRALRPKQARLQSLPLAAAQRKASQFLMRRGFDYETIRQALEQILDA